MNVDNLKVYLSMNSVELCLTICIRYLVVKKNCKIGNILISIFTVDEFLEMIRIY